MASASILRIGRSFLQRSVATRLRKYTLPAFANRPAILGGTCTTISCSGARRDGVRAGLHGGAPLQALEFGLSDIIKLAESSKKENYKIKLLPSKPPHRYQTRPKELNEVKCRLKELREQNVDDVVVTLYIKAPQAMGKTQLAREYGEVYYNELVGTVTIKTPVDSYTGKKVLVAHLDADSESSFWRSYFSLATHLGCSFSWLNSVHRFEDRLNVISTVVKMKLKECRDWFLIVDGKMSKAFTSFWPQPGSEEWGRGFVLVATRDKEVIQPYDDLTSVYDLPEMSEEDAVQLLNKVSKCPGSDEDAKTIVNSSSVGRIPQFVASTAIRIKDIQAKNPGFTYKDYLEMNQGADEVTSSDPQTLTLVKTINQLISTEPCLREVFTALALCRHDPVPMSMIVRLLGEHQKDKIHAVRDCELLMITGSGKETLQQEGVESIEGVHTHALVHETFKSLLNQDSTKQTDLVHKVVQCLLKEYEEASWEQYSTSSVGIKQMLFPHLEAFLENGAISLDEKIQLHLALSSVFLEVAGNAEKSKRVLKNLRMVLTEENTKLDELRPHYRAKISLGFGKAYRHLGQYGKSAQWLKLSLDEKKYLNDVEVAEVLKEFSATVSSYGHYMQSREHLEGALRLYKKSYHKEALAEALSGLAYLSVQMGEWKEAEQFIKESECALDASFNKKYNPQAHENLGTAYMLLGDHNKSIVLLEKAVQERKHCNQHAALALPLARLSAAYYFQGSEESIAKSEEIAKEALKQRDTIPWAALQILGANIFVRGDITKADENLLKSIMEKLKKGNIEDGDLLLGKIYRMTGDLGQAQKTLEDFLARNEARFRKEFDADHNIRDLHEGRALAHLGKLYQEQGYLTQSLSAFYRSYKIHEMLYGRHGHPEVAFILADLARLIQRAGNVERGTTMMKDALRMCEESMNSKSIQDQKTPMHIKYATKLSNYGVILRDAEKYEEAEKTLEEALKLQDKNLAQSSLMRIKTIYRLGTVYDRQKQPTTAMEQMKVALQHMDCVSPAHPFRATILTGMARLFVANDVLKAEKHAMEALEVRKMCCGEIHPQVAYCCRILGDISLSRNDPLSAHKHLLKAHTIYARILEREANQALFHREIISEFEPFRFENWKKKQTMIENKLHDIVKQTLN